MRAEGASGRQGTLVGSNRDVATLAGRLRGGTSLVVAGPRGSGRSFLLRAIAGELGRSSTTVIAVKPSAALSRVEFGALAATGSEALGALRAEPHRARVDAVVVVDDVDLLDPVSLRLLATAVAARRVTAVFGLRTSRPRAVERPAESDHVRAAVLDLWAEGLARRCDLLELSGDEALQLIDLSPDAAILDSATRAGLVWRADGSRSLLQHLLVEAIAAARAGRDPLTALRTVARDSRLAVAVARHASDFPRPDLECLAGVRRLPRLELAAATRLFNAESVHALLATGLLHADASAERRLTANDLIAHEAQRRIGVAHLEALVDGAGARMLAEEDEWWSRPIAVAVSQRWHRLGPQLSGETAHPPALRARVALAAAQEANDHGDAAHAAAHAARGLQAVDDPALRVEVALAHEGPPSAATDTFDRHDVDARRRAARVALQCSDSDVAVAVVAAADARVEELLDHAAQAGMRLDWASAADAAGRAVSESDASCTVRLRAAVAAGTAEAFRGAWRDARHHYRSALHLLDARPSPRDIRTRDRLAAVMTMLSGHLVAGADGSELHERLQRELLSTAREEDPAELTIAGAAAAIAFASAGRPDESRRELTSALSRERSAVADPAAAMIEMAVAEELALAGRLDEARAVLLQVDDLDAPLLRRSRLYVETTVLVAEGRLKDARDSARATADLSRSGTAAALRIRDLFRLATLGEAQADEIDELVQLAATTDLPVASEAVRRASARSGRQEHLPVDELRLHALWSVSTSRPDDPGVPPSTGATSAPAGEQLTAREHEIALLAYDGLTNREIATRLFLSIRTVESHVYQARLKVGAASRRELAMIVAGGGDRIGAGGGNGPR